MAYYNQNPPSVNVNVSAPPPAQGAFNYLDYCCWFILYTVTLHMYIKNYDLLLIVCFYGEYICG